MKIKTKPIPQQTQGQPQPTRIVEVELSEPLAPIMSYDTKTGIAYSNAWVLVRLQRRPIGLLTLALPAHGISAEVLAKQIWGALSAEITQQGEPIHTSKLSQHRLPSLRQAQPQRAADADLPGIAVIVATHNRTAGLARCLQSLLALDYPNFTIIVVDNAPSSNETADFIQGTYGNSSQVRYVREDRPGLACAHNCGLALVNQPIVAFTDDDVVVDDQWLRALAAGFAQSSKVGCVTGMILPAELETPAQHWIEQSAGFNKGFRRRLFDLQENHPGHPLFPYAVGMCGSGANMAFRSEVLRQMGGFDPALGAGSRGVGGDDLAAFFEVLVHGYTLVYEPAAFLYHWHYRDYTILRRQAYGYGVSLTAYLMKTLIDHPRLWFSFIKRIPQGLRFGLSAHSEKNQRKQSDYPQELTTLERQGMLWGPVAYLQSRWHVYHSNA